MSLFRSSRERRIDRALSNVLEQIDERRSAMLDRCGTWSEVNLVTMDANMATSKAHDRANHLQTQWLKRVDADA